MNQATVISKKTPARDARGRFLLGNKRHDLSMHFGKTRVKYGRLWFWSLALASSEGHR